MWDFDFSFFLTTQTFTTQETITNAESAKAWLLESAKEVSINETMKEKINDFPANCSSPFIKSWDAAIVGGGAYLLFMMG